MPKKDLTPEEIANMGDEDISKLSVDNEGKIQGAASEGDDEASEESGEETEETTEEETEETTETEESEEGGENQEEGSEEGASEEETTSESEESEESEELEEVTHDPLKDTQRKLTKVAQENADLRRKNRELEKKALEQKKPAEPKKYTQEELDDLYATDPEQWRRVMNEIESYDSRKKEFELAERNFEQTEQIERLAETQVLQLTSLLDFADMMKIEVDKNLTFDKQPEAVKKFFTSREMKEVDEFLKEHQELRDKKTGVFTAKTIRMAYRDLNFDKLVTPERKKAYRSAVDNIKNANKGSKLQGARQADAKGRKKIKDLTEAELANLGEEDTGILASEI